MTAPVWSIRVQNVGTGALLFERHSDVVLHTASVGKVLLLVHVAELVRSGQLNLAEPLTRTARDRVADSGVWQYLATETLPVGDLCELVGIASDNLATNVLIARVELDPVAATAARLGLRDTALHDRVRDVRTSADPPTLSSGSAAELVGLMMHLYRGATAGDQVAARVLGWLSKGMDLSQVAAGWNLDPLAHRDGGGELQVVNKTGADVGVRAEIGLLTGPAATIAYAVVANWDTEGAAHGLDLVLAGQRRLGLRIRDVCRGEQWTDPSPAEW